MMTVKNTPTLDVLKRLTDGLVYISDTDSTWQVWSTSAKRPRIINANTFLGLTNYRWCIEQNFDTWFKHTIHSQGVSQGQEVQKRYEKLYEGMIEMLSPRFMFKTDAGSPNRFVYYAVGQDFEGNLLGVSAESVET